MLQGNGAAANKDLRAHERDEAIDKLFSFARTTLAREGVTPASVRKVERELARLAIEEGYFDIEEFPPSAEETGIALYQLRVSDDESLALYLNVLQPGKQSKPHNHKTWAAIAAVDGEELNRVYQRTDDRADPSRATLAVVHETNVRPGTSISFMPEDIHSIHGGGTRTIRHLHMYGCPLEKLQGREGFDLNTGEIVNYNMKYMTPSILPADRARGEQK